MFLGETLYPYLTLGFLQCLHSPSLPLRRNRKWYPLRVSQQWRHVTRFWLVKHWNIGEMGWRWNIRCSIKVVRSSITTVTTYLVLVKRERASRVLESLLFVNLKYWYTGTLTRHTFTLRWTILASRVWELKY